MAETEKKEYPMIYRSIAGVIADVGAVGKDKMNKQQGFKFRSIDDVYNACIRRWRKIRWSSCRIFWNGR